MLFPGPIWLAGCGHMGSAILAGWLRCGLDPAQVTIIRPSGTPLPPPIRVLMAPPEDEVPALMLLAMKPAQLAEAAALLAPAIAPETILVSVLAGIPLERLRAHFPAPRDIIRALPNLPVRIGEGVVALAGDEGAALDRVEALMRPLGTLLRLPEGRMDAVTAIAGSGPAFFYRFVAAMAAGGAQLGLDPATADMLARATARGAAMLATGSPDSLEALAAAVTSKKGTTAAGLEVLDADHMLADLVARALTAARDRAEAMMEDASRAD